MQKPETADHSVGTPTDPLWEFRHVSKAFPGVQALDGVSLSLKTGDVHALVGQNGSGKSTLVRCVAGVHEPDDGELLHRGKRVRLRDPMAAREHGVAAFHQEFSLISSLSVAENVCLGRLPLRRGMVDWSAVRREAKQALAQLDVELPPDALVHTLSVAEQQFVELAKAISQDASLLILDEPTAALGPSEVERLHRVITKLADGGRAVLYISHRLDEVLSIANRVTVIKDGKVVGTHSTAKVTLDQVVRMMVGVDLDEHISGHGELGRETWVEVRDLVSDGGVQGITFDIARGEILGLAGIAGAGRTAVAHALYGADRILGGQLLIDGQPVHLKSPSDAIAAGIGLVPENRKAHGLFFNLTSPENITIVDLEQVRHWGVLQLGQELRLTRELVDKLRIEGNVMNGGVQFLSGGNQQKIMLARWMFSQARLLILDEPTQGIDVSAKIEAHRLLGEFSDAGLAMLLISSDFSELLSLSDRICVLRGGRIVHEALRGELTEHDLVEIAAGGKVA